MHNGYLVIDTETNKLADFDLDADHPDQPRLAEAAFIYLDLGLVVQHEYQRYIKPDGWIMHPDATAKNGLTTEQLEADGVDIAEVLNTYERAITGDGRAVIAFGAQFDCKVMRGELRRAGRPDMFYETPNVCLMREARPFAKKISRPFIKYGFKPDGVTPVGQGGWPKLSDLCRFLNVEQKGEHGAIVDTHSTLECLNAMVELGFEIKPEIHESKDLAAIRNRSAS